MATTQYIGSRYVPIFADPIEWSSTKKYEPLTIVTHEGNSYTSRQFVPVGVEITNQEFWAITGNYNAQVEQYRRDVLACRNEITSLDEKTTAITERTTTIESAMPITDFTSETPIKKYIDDSVSTSETTIKQYIDDSVSEKINVYPSTASLKDASDLTVGDYVTTLGFYSAGDGGGATYQIDNTGSANDIDVFACGDLFAKLVTDAHHINVLQYGVKNDGVTDVTSLVQYIFNNAPRGADVYFPAGHYLITSGLTTPNDKQIDLRGDLNNFMDPDLNLEGVTYINFIDVPAGTTCLNFLNTSKTSIKNIFFYSNAYDATMQRENIGDSVNCFSETINIENVTCISTVAQSSIENCHFRGFIYAFGKSVTPSGYHSIHHCYFLKNKYAIHVGADNTISDVFIYTCYRGITIWGSINMLTNIRGDSIGTYLIQCNGNRTVITNVNADYCQNAAVQINGDSNQVRGITGRCGTSHPDPTTSRYGSTQIKSQSSFVVIIKGKCNYIEVPAKRHNPLDVDSEFLVPLVPVTLFKPSGTDNVITENTIMITEEGEDTGTIVDLTTEPFVPTLQKLLWLVPCNTDSVVFIKYKNINMRVVYANNTFSAANLSACEYTATTSLSV